MTLIRTIAQKSLLIGQIIAGLVFAYPALAEVSSDPLASPQARVLLTISGNIAQRNDGVEAVFDLAMLQQLPKHQLLTSTPWTEGIQRFEGVLLKDLLAKVTPEYKTIKVMAIDNFSAKISDREINDYPVMLAYLHNGQPMKIRHKGPLWVIYPLDQYPELKKTIYHDRMVWQLDRIEVR